MRVSLNLSSKFHNKNYNRDFKMTFFNKIILVQNNVGPKADLCSTPQ